MTSLLYGTHDREGRQILPAGGWCVDTRALSELQPPTDYAALRGDINWIVRLNHGYGATGTIPLPDQYPQFAAACANYVAKSKGARHFVIGNEPNGEWERPGGVFITPEQYARCFALCRDAIKRADPNAQVLPAPCAPYHASPVDWLAYWHDMLRIIEGNGGCDAVNIHAYARSMNPDDITSGAKMGPPLQDQFSGFFTYLDALSEVPATLRHLPAFVTEFNVIPEWRNENTGVIQEMYAEINRWNARPDTQKILAGVCFRWLGPPDVENVHDWEMRNKPQLLADFRAAVAKGYQSPQVGAQGQEPMETHLPSASTGTAPSPSPTQPRDIDPRATARGVTVLTPRGIPLTWRVKSVRWYDEQEADRLGPDHHIMADVLDEQGKRLAGVPLMVRWPTDEHRIVTEAKPGEPYAANYPLSPSRNEFSIMVDGLALSEVVDGIGMGMETPGGFNAGVHTTTAVVFQRVAQPAVAVPAQPPVSTGPTPAPQTLFVSVPSGANLRRGPSVEYELLRAAPIGTALTVTGSTPARDWLQVEWDGVKGWVLAALLSPVQPQPVATQPAPQEPVQGDNWARSRAFIAKWEGGWAEDPNDPGGATQKGITLGTYTRWRAAHGQPQPTKAELRAISDEEADRIFYEWYWLESGADKLAWPMCLAVVDLAVNGGVGRAVEAFGAVGHNSFVAYMAWRLEWYTRISGWKHFGTAWARRVADLLRMGAV